VFCGEQDRASLLICSDQPIKLIARKTRILVSQSSPSYHNSSDDISDLSSCDETFRSYFVEYVLRRDSNTCVFCGEQDRASLAAARVMDDQRYDDEVSMNYLVNKFGIMSTYEPRNGLTWCLSGLDVFDAHLCCVSTNECDVDGNIIYQLRVAEVILQSKAFKKKWSFLNDENIRFTNYVFQMRYWPSLEQYSFNTMNSSLHRRRQRGTGFDRLILYRVRYVSMSSNLRKDFLDTDTLCSV
jgi:hypothetical protein